MPYHNLVGEKTRQGSNEHGQPHQRQVALAATETAADHTTRRSCRGHGAGHSAPCLGHGNNGQKTSANPPAVGLISWNPGTGQKPSPAPSSAAPNPIKTKSQRSCLSHRKHRTTRRAAASPICGPSVHPYPTPTGATAQLWEPVPRYRVPAVPTPKTASAPSARVLCSQAKWSILCRLIRPPETKRGRGRPGLSISATNRHSRTPTVIPVLQPPFRRSYRHSGASRNPEISPVQRCSSAWATAKPTGFRSIESPLPQTPGLSHMDFAVSGMIVANAAWREVK